KFRLRRSGRVNEHGAIAQKAALSHPLFEFLFGFNRQDLEADSGAAIIAGPGNFALDFKSLLSPRKKKFEPGRAALIQPPYTLDGDAAFTDVGNAYGN